MKQIVLSNKLLIFPIFVWFFIILSIPSFSASEAPLLSLDNTDFVVSLAFVAFILLLIYFKVPSKIAKLLDGRSKSIAEEINNANLILEDSKTMLADLEREHKLNIEKAKQIVIAAETEAKNLLSDAKKEVRLTIERKVKLAEEQIRASEASVIKSIKDKAIDQSILLAESELAKQSKAKIEELTLKNTLKQIEQGFKEL